MENDTILYHLNCEICGGDFYDIEAFPNPHYCPQCLEARKRGIKEVVDWLKRKEVSHDVLGAVRFYASREEYEAKLKEWGIDGHE